MQEFIFKFKGKGKEIMLPSVFKSQKDELEKQYPDAFKNNKIAIAMENDCITISINDKKIEQEMKKSFNSKGNRIKLKLLQPFFDIKLVEG